MAHSGKQAGTRQALKKQAKRTVLILACILAGGYMLPEQFVLPVSGMNDRSFHHRSFWYYPWGASVRHKGVDIFARKGTSVCSSTPGIVLYCGQREHGGSTVLVLGPKWRIHHYLHLDTILAKPYSLIRQGKTIGKVGNSGNARGKPSHLHYAISTPIPYVWQASTGIQGWKKIWYIDPTPYLLRTTS